MLAHMAEHALSPSTVAVLRKADRRLRTAERGSILPRYSACRSALSCLAPVDSFYVGQYSGESTLVLPYMFDHHGFLGSEVQEYGPRGMSHWIRMSRRTYRWSQDAGALAMRGYPDDTTRPYRDVVVVPLLDRESGEATGLMAIQSHTAGVFSDELVHAMEWLVRALVSSIDRDRSDAEDLELYLVFPELNSSSPRDRRDLAHELSARVAQLGHLLEGMGPDDTATQRAQILRQARDLCRRIQQDTAEALLADDPAPTTPPNPICTLTEREREIAVLISDHQLTNAAISDRLDISEKTVKGHVGNILRKLGVPQRSAIKWVLAGDC